MSAPKAEAAPIMSAPKVMVNLALAMFAALSLASAPLIYFLWVEPNRLIARFHLPRTLLFHCPVGSHRLNSAPRLTSRRPYP